MLHLIWSIVIGFIVGLIARAILPGVDHMGFWMTAAVGIGGSLLGGLLGMLISLMVAERSGFDVHESTASSSIKEFTDRMTEQAIASMEKSVGPDAIDAGKIQNGRGRNGPALAETILS